LRVAHPSAWLDGGGPGHGFDDVGKRHVEPVARGCPCKAIASLNAVAAKRREK
jgi:hypothetical protein